jgi:phospholipid transport system transporter-binding protein
MSGTLRREADVLLIEGPLTLQTAAALLDPAEEYFKAGVHTIDLSGVPEVDSAAVALALEWQRRAGRHGVALRLQNLPEAMQNLASLYGVSELLLQPA